MEWDLSNISKYRLHSLTIDVIDDLIRESIKIIHKLLGEKIWSNCISYRAGGWAIQPFSHLKSVFKKYNIMIDSSVSAGISNNNRPFDYNFKKVASNIPYYFSENVCTNRQNGDFLEVPITSYKYTFFMKLASKADKYIRPEKYKVSGSGTPIKSNNFKKNMHEYFKTDVVMLSIDRMQPNVFQYILKRTKEDIVVMIAHPKDYSISSGLCLKKAANIKDMTFVKIGKILSK
jgi:hypothetical protein